MDAMEYLDHFLDLENKYSQDQNQFEFYSFIVATLSLEDPVKLKQLENQFRRIEPNVVALRAIQDHHTSLRDIQAHDTSEECPF